MSTGFDINYWIVYNILWANRNYFFTVRLKVLYFMVEVGGTCKSLRYMSRSLDVPVEFLSVICSELHHKQILKKTRIGNRVEITLHNRWKESAKKTINALIKNE